MQTLLAAFAVLCAIAVPAASVDTPILMIGASYENGKTPCVVDKVNVIGCLSVGFGQYLSLSQALSLNPWNAAIVINEAIGGATTFDRPGYIIPTEQQAEIGWEEDGFDKQLQRAILAATNPYTGKVTAVYVVIGAANDCLHSNAFETAPSASAPCSLTDINAVIDRYVAIGQRAVAAGLTPVYTGYPPLADPGATSGVDLALAQPVHGFLFTIEAESYGQLVSLFNSRVPAEVPSAIMANAWKRFEHIGDGLHPTVDTARGAASRVMMSIVKRKP
ncbi:MAG: hypothetical protein QNK18_15930 [Gammaproteobacteria bacterium]|nr:hypothetical protein [Gammaproteobacteria bacterium]MDJ0892668.1 hypothetical protein [Gammaproteobacteria bacterium]